MHYDKHPSLPWRKTVLVFGMLLSLLAAVWTSNVAQAAPATGPAAIVNDDGLPPDPVRARVAGRDVRVDQDKTTTELGHAKIPLAEFMRALGTTKHTVSSVQLMTDSGGRTLSDVSAEMVVRTGGDGPRLLIDILDSELGSVQQLLARHNLIRLCFIVGGYRICIDIGWNQEATPSVRVDGRQANVRAVEAQIDDEPASYAEVLALVGTTVLTPTVLSVKDARGNELDPSGVQVRMRGRFQEVSGLGPELAMHGSNTICFGLGPWRICLTIEWEGQLDPLARVDGVAVGIEDMVILLGGEEVFPLRLARLAGREPYPFDHAALASLLNNENITTWEAAWVRGVFTLQNSTQQESRALRLLAREGKAQLTLQNDEDDLHIVMTLVWPEPRELPELQVQVDGREVLIDGEARAEIDGEAVDLWRGLEATGRKPITLSDLEIRLTDGTTVTVPDAYAVMPGDNIKLFYGLSNLIARELRAAPAEAAAVKIEICTTIGKVKVCIPITIGKKREPKVVLLEPAAPLAGATEGDSTGRSVPVTRVDAWVDGVPIDPLRITGFGSFENKFTVEITGAGGSSTADMSAELRDGAFLIEGFDQQAHGFRPATICLEVVEFGYRWRICVTIPVLMAQVPGGGRVDLPDYDLHGNVEVEVEEGEPGDRPAPTGFTYQKITWLRATDEGGRLVDGLGKPVGLLLPAVQQAVALAQAPTVDDYIVGWWDAEAEVWVELSIALEADGSLISTQVDRFGEIGLFLRDSTDEEEDEEDEDDEEEEDDEETPQERALYLPALGR